MSLTKKEINYFADQLPKGVKVVDGTDWLPKDMNAHASWRFVEKWYPKYDSSDSIAWEQDLSKIINGLWEDGDAAHDKYLEMYEEQQAANPESIDEELILLVQTEAERQQKELLCDIYKLAIEGFMEFMKGGINGK